MKRTLALLLALLTVALAGCNTAGGNPADTTNAGNIPAQIDENNYNIISVEEYLDKTTMGMLGQFVGFLSGYEFARDSNGVPRTAMPDSWFEICNGPYAEPNSRNKHEDKLLKNEESGLWEVWNDDDFSIDILNQYILADMYRDRGTFASTVITDGWVNYNVYDMGGGHRSTGAYGLMKSKRYLPVYSGSYEYGNIYSFCGEPYIANETLGMDAAGMPNTAVDMAGIFGGVTGDCDNVEWLKLFAAMYAMAYFESDVQTLIRTAAEVLPADSVQREIIDTVFSLYEKYPTDWRRAVVNAEKLCYRHHYGETTMMGETGINCSFILIGLVYGNGDFYETCKITSLAGHGGDSTTPVGLGIAGIISGTANMPAAVNEKVWQDGKGVLVNLPPENTNSAYYMYCAGLPERINIADVITMYQTNFESILTEAGGFIKDGKYYIPKSELKKADTVSIANTDFEKATLNGWNTSGSVKLSDVDTAYNGKYSARLNGTEGGDSAMYTTVEGLTVGATYKLTAFVYTAASSTVHLFARNVGDTGYDSHACAAVYDMPNFVRRDFVFTASAESMEIGAAYDGTNEYKYAVVDNFSLVRIDENEAGTISGLTTGKVSGSVSFTATSDIRKQVYIKVVFANPDKSKIDAAVTVNGASFNSVPFYKTGKTASQNAVDCAYIPVLLGDGENTVALDFAQSGIEIKSAQIVTVDNRR